VFTRTIPLPVAAHEAFDWHERPGAFERLAPSWEKIRVVRREGGIRDGGVLQMQLKRGPLWLTWEALHHDYVYGSQFVDVATRSPFSQWRHVHKAEPRDTGCILHDEITYRLPLHPLTSWFAGPLVRRELERMFRQRHARTHHDLVRHKEMSMERSLKVAVTGSSGMVGRALCSFLSGGGHEVWRVVRGRKSADGVPSAGEIMWDPAKGEIDRDALEGLDAVVHLAGAGIADQRWNDARKRVILDSREQGTRVLCEALAALERPPAVLISASASGYYGASGDAPCDETSPAGDGFLAEVCVQWEAAAQPARDAGIRVVHPRLGMVVSASGGALERMLTPFRMGVGGKLGDGRQPISWISLDDTLAALLWLITRDDAVGAYNLCAPAPVSNAVFTKALGRALGRPTVLPVPGFAIRALFGEMGQQLLLEGRTVLPRRLIDEGFRFTHHTIDQALNVELGTGPVAGAASHG